MAAADEPLVARDFQVRLIIRGPRGGLRDEIESACSRVVLPSLRLDDRDPAVTTGAVHAAGTGRDLVLQRGHAGGSDWFTMWRAARDRERDQLRDVIVTVLDADFRPAVAWHFTGCRVVALDHSALDALDAGVLVERLEIAFDAVEQVAARTNRPSKPAKRSREKKR